MPLPLNSFRHSFPTTRDSNYETISEKAYADWVFVTPTTTVRIIRSLENAVTREACDWSTFLLSLFGEFEPRGLLLVLLLGLLSANLCLFLILLLLPFFLGVVFCLSLANANTRR